MKQHCQMHPWLIAAKHLNFAACDVESCHWTHAIRFLVCPDVPLQQSMYCKASAALEHQCVSHLVTDATRYSESTRATLLHSESTLVFWYTAHLSTAPCEFHSVIIRNSLCDFKSCARGHLVIYNQRQADESADQMSQQIR